MKRTRVMKWVLVIGSVALSLVLFMKRSREKANESILNEPLDTPFIQATELRASGAT